jgi:hypothetical protein
MMREFTQRGFEHPAKQLTRKAWRESLVKGIVEDDLPYSLVEKRGMRQMFTLILPTGYPLPSHQTVRRDIDRLYEGMNKKVNATLQVRLSWSNTAG